MRKQLNGVTSKLETTSELLTRTENQLEHAKKTREELYEKYANSRDENRLEYERRLQYELDRIRYICCLERNSYKSILSADVASECRPIQKSGSYRTIRKNRLSAKIAVSARRATWPCSKETRYRRISSDAVPEMTLTNDNCEHCTDTLILSSIWEADH